MDYLVNQFGAINEEIDEELLEDILEELSTLKEYSFELAMAAIELGKPQILEFILETNDFSEEDFKSFENHVEEFVKHSDENDQDIIEIVSTFEDLINNAKNPKKKKWKK